MNIKKIWNNFFFVIKSLKNDLQNCAWDDLNGTAKGKLSDRNYISINNRKTIMP